MKELGRVVLWLIELVVPVSALRRQLYPAQRGICLAAVLRRASDEQKQPPQQQHSESQSVGEQQQDQECMHSRPR